MQRQTFAFPQPTDPIPVAVAAAPQNSRYLRRFSRSAAPFSLSFPRITLPVRDHGATLGSRNGFIYC